jgi:hypothetical protein
MSLTSIDSRISCPICNQALDMRAAVLDENGKAVHEDCYVAFITAPFHSSPEWTKRAA